MFFQKIYRLKYLWVKRYYCWDRPQRNAGRAVRQTEWVQSQRRGDTTPPARSAGMGGRYMGVILLFSPLRWFEMCLIKDLNTKDVYKDTYKSITF